MLYVQRANPLTYEHNLLTYERYIRRCKFTPRCNFEPGSKFLPGCKLCIKTRLKTSKTGHFGVLLSKSSDYCLNFEKSNAIRLPRRSKKNNKIHVLSIHFTNDHIFFDTDNYQNLSGKTEKYLSTVYTCFGTGHVTVLSTRGADLI